MQKIPVAKLDVKVFNSINGFAKKSRMLDFFGIFCAKYLGLLLVFALAMFAWVAGSANMFLFPVAAGLASLALNEAVYLFYRRKRPVEVIPQRMLIAEAFSPAFPSSHTSFFFALSFTLFLFNFQLAIVFLALGSIISISRIFCGVHWPSDIAGGVCSAIVSFLVIYGIIP